MLISTLSLPVYFIGTGLLLFACLFSCLFVCVYLYVYLICFPSPLTLPFEISSLLLLQARKYLIAHNTGTLTIARAMMGRWKKGEN
jgi:1,4-dihydroxy-2-naphthoate octaprenyltransferase